MDHDQEKFYTDEEVDSRAADQQGEQEVNDTTYFIELMKHLRTLIERGSRIPLSNKVVIDGNKCLMILDEIDKNLPDAIQYGIKMYSERDRLLTESESTAAKPRRFCGDEGTQDARKRPPHGVADHCRRRRGGEGEAH